MKNSFGLVIAILILLTSVSALSETFSIHSGVQFGMTMDEVIQKENDAGFNVRDREIHIAKGYNCPEDHDEVELFVDGQIAGIEDSRIRYHFCKNGGLDSAIYELGSEYWLVREPLIKKYGEPEDKVISEMCHEHLDLDVYSDIDYVDECSFARPAGYKISDLQYDYADTWLIPQEDGGYVVITGCKFSYKETIYALNQSGTYSYDRIGYQYFSKEEIDLVISKAVEKVNTYNKQLEDDL